MSKEIVLRIDGMHCGACVRRVTQALQCVPDAEVGEVRVGAARVRITGEATEQALLSSLAQTGFTAHVEN